MQPYFTRDTSQTNAIDSSSISHKLIGHSDHPPMLYANVGGSPIRKPEKVRGVTIPSAALLNLGHVELKQVVQPC